MATKKTEDVSFESAMTELDTIVQQLENGDLPLEEALKQFERGVGLVNIGQKKLTDAEQRVEILLAQSDDAPLSTFQQDEDE
ncbi:Exodeoxyribonuclease 7 small subunit [Vibrio stylophorae]|uniref:Exodeoxyribonuclease 7 small subunit n=1 Tax=Vibrio stylophorae TaxID=659351 RepID=A0ABM8ZRJ4_9VIBR|nr:exodeoxyribonuclease VII small subunit [Vibrio stylophorae]CAH0532913.1 Exodeoxyribonuclease 7 small subunit [Vibrio stylophorae]